TSKASPPAPTRADRQDNTDQEGLLQRFPRCDAEMYQAGKAARNVTSRPTHDDLPLPFGWKAEWQGEICCPDFMRHKPSAAAAPRHGSLQRGHSCPTPAVSCVAVQASADNTAHRRRDAAAAVGPGKCLHLSRALDAAMPDRLFLPFVENQEYIADLL